MFDGLMQVSGMAMLIFGLAFPQNVLVRDDAPYVGSKNKSFAWSVAPQTFGRSGYGLGMAATSDRSRATGVVGIGRWGRSPEVTEAIMDTRIVPGGSRADVLTTDSAPRVTPSSGVPFRDMVARGAGVLIRGAEAAVTSLPGRAHRRGRGSVRRGHPLGHCPIQRRSGRLRGLARRASRSRLGREPHPPAAGGPAGESSSVEGALAQSQEFNLYYFQLQEQLAAENRAYSAMSNVLKARHDTVKNAIGNIR